MEEEDVCATQEPVQQEDEEEEYFAATQEPAAEDTLQLELPRLALRQQLGQGLAVVCSGRGESSGSRAAGLCGFRLMIRVVSVLSR